MADIRQLRGTPSALPSAPTFGEAEGDELDLVYLLGVLRRRKYLIAGIVFLITSFTALFVSQITPLYRAEALLVLEENQSNVLNIDAVTRGMRTDYYTNETEAAVIGSRALAVKAVKRLNLTEDPMFNPFLVPPQPSLWAAIGAWLFGKAEEKDWTSGMTPEAVENYTLELVTDYYLADLYVQPSLTSRIMSVGYSSTDPATAARLANAAAEIYILDQLETRGAATVRATDWLNERVEQLRLRVIESERRFDVFRRESGIVEVGSTNVYQQQLAELSTQLIASRGQRAEAEAREQQIRQLMASSGNIESAAAVIDSPLIQKLREQEAELLRKVSELKTQFREGHPKLLLAQNEIGDLREKIANEVNKIARNIGYELEIARVREANLQTEVRNLQHRIEEQAEAEATLNSLESEIKANKQLYETVLTRFKETKVQDEDLIQANARVISPAVEPSRPYYPKKRLMVMAALFASLVAGIALAFMLEYLDSGFRTAEQLENVTGQPVLGIFPYLRDGKVPYLEAVDRPNSIFGEAVRRLRTSLALSDVHGRPKTLMVTSSVPGEGKTSLAVAIAASAAKSGQKCVLVDCDLRHPSVHRVMELANDRGLSTHLTGQASLGDVLEVDLRSGLRVIPAGPIVPHPADLLGLQEMRSLIHRLEELFDFVVLDAPPLLAVSDALVLTRGVNKVIFVVRWAKTDRNTVKAALRQLLEAGGEVAGLVLSLVDIRKGAPYGLGSSGRAYYEGYDRYYKEI